MQIPLLLADVFIRHGSDLFTFDGGIALGCTKPLRSHISALMYGDVMRPDSMSTPPTTVYLGGNPLL